MISSLLGAHSNQLKCLKMQLGQGWGPKVLKNKLQREQCGGDGVVLVSHDCVAAIVMQNACSTHTSLLSNWT